MRRVLKNKWGKSCTAIVSIVLCTCGTLRPGIVREHPYPKYANKGTLLRLQPSFGNDALGNIHKGTKVTCLGWYRTGGPVNFYYVAIGTDTGFIERKDLADSTAALELT